MRGRIALLTPKAFASLALPATAGGQCEIYRGRPPATLTAADAA